MEPPLGIGQREGPSMRKPRVLCTLAVWLVVLPASGALSQERFTRGDCNANGNLVRGVRCELTDAIFLLNYLFLSGSAPPCLEACNVNDSPNLDIADAVYLLSFCFIGGSPPPLPFPECGTDPTLPSLGCREFLPCRGSPGCEPQDAQGVGPCEAIVGIFWDGFRCRVHSGCSCEGEDCDESYQSIEDCYRAHSDCESVCQAMDARGVGPCLAILGYAWDGFRCEGLSGCECEGEDCDRLHESLEECQVAVQGCPPLCGLMDVRGVGPCDAVLGYYWDGFRCAELSGCECEGEDCDLLHRTREECEVQHAGCPSPCTPMDVRGVGLCALLLGYYWDGTSCRSISGCDCEGADCEDLLPTEEECQRAFEGCQ